MWTRRAIREAIESPESSDVGGIEFVRFGLHLSLMTDLDRNEPENYASNYENATKNPDARKRVVGLGERVGRSLSKVFTEVDYPGDGPLPFPIIIWCLLERPDSDYITSDDRSHLRSWRIDDVSKARDLFDRLKVMLDGAKPAKPLIRPSTEGFEPDPWDLRHAELDVKTAPAVARAHIAKAHFAYALISRFGFSHVTAYKSHAHSWTTEMRVSCSLKVTHGSRYELEHDESVIYSLDAVTTDPCSIDFSELLVRLQLGNRWQDSSEDVRCKNAADVDAFVLAQLPELRKRRARSQRRRDLKARKEGKPTLADLKAGQREKDRKEREISSTVQVCTMAGPLSPEPPLVADSSRSRQEVVSAYVAAMLSGDEAYSEELSFDVATLERWRQDRELASSLVEAELRDNYGRSKETYDLRLMATGESRLRVFTTVGDEEPATFAEFQTFAYTLSFRLDVDALASTVRVFYHHHPETFKDAEGVENVKATIEEMARTCPRPSYGGRDNSGYRYFKRRELTPLGRVWRDMPPEWRSYGQD